MLQCQWVHGKDVVIMAVAGMEAKRCLKKRHCFKAQRYRPALRSRNVRLHFSQLVPARQTSALSPFVTEVHCFMKDDVGLKRHQIFDNTKKVSRVRTIQLDTEALPPHNQEHTYYQNLPHTLHNPYATYMVYSATTPPLEGR